MNIMRLPLVLCILLFCSSFIYGSDDKKHFIVYMGKSMNPNTEAVVSSDKALLATVCNGKEKALTVHHYCKSFRGFSALLTPNQAQLLLDTEEVISVFESKTHAVHTTHSWDFLGISPEVGLQPKSIHRESDVIIGSIDGGVWPESKSFNDEGLGPIPKRFKGECKTGDNFTLSNCNRKIIGARFYSKGFEAENGPLEQFGETYFRSARDSEGHGTHTASTAAGSPVSNASFLGIANGLLRGGAPGARLAIYKACWFNLCSDADVLSAFDDAIKDGVDIISISAGPSPPQPSLFEDVISIGSFHAFKNNILVSASAGNAGLPGTATNTAPWILTVAASSIDRAFVGVITLGNSQILKGTSLNPTGLEGSFGIIPANAAAAKGVSTTNASFCKANTLSNAKVSGKIIVCSLERITDDRIGKSGEVKRAGGVGMIFVDPIATGVAFHHLLPAVSIGLSEARKLMSYINSTKHPVGKISQTFTVLKTKPAPQVALFSSAGPSALTPDIIKPDITAPGMNILAAWSPVSLVNMAAGKPVDFNIISGTSMSCPHVTGASAIVKSRHRFWSPAALKSALMTTATVIDNTKSNILRYPAGAIGTPFDYGSGHLNPIAAINPGLVYDYDLSDIVDFLCFNGATSSQLRNLTGIEVPCSSRKTKFHHTYNLNYPSIAVSNVKGKMSVFRTVKNCHKGLWNYSVSVEEPVGVRIKVVPEKLSFSKVAEKKTFRVDIVPVKVSNGSFVFGSITWKDGVHSVRSPLALNVVSVQKQ